MKIDLGDGGWQSLLAQTTVEGTIEWRNMQTGTLHGWASYILGPTSENGAQRNLVLDTTRDEYPDRQVVRLELAPAGWSVPRWLARCPKHCERLARKIYAVHQGQTFSCWRCAGLSHRSAQQHDRRRDLARRDPVGFIQSRSRAPQTANSQWVTARLAYDAQISGRPGRGWARNAVTSGTRAIAQMHREFRDRWGFELADVARIARGGRDPEDPDRPCARRFSERIGGKNCRKGPHGADARESDHMGIHSTVNSVIGT